MAKAYQTPELAGVFSSYKISVPQLYADLDRTKAMQLGVDVQDVFNTMQIYLGSMYVNDFNKFGRTYQVVAQADMEFRSKPDDILKLQTQECRRPAWCRWARSCRSRKPPAPTRRCATTRSARPI